MIDPIDLSRIRQGLVTTQQMQAYALAQKSFATYALLRAAKDEGSLGLLPCNVYVITDESNDNQPTYYLWSGSALQWIPTLDI